MVVDGHSPDGSDRYPGLERTPPFAAFTASAVQSLPASPSPVTAGFSPAGVIVPSLILLFV